jgi:hypothetical protein
VSIPYPRTTYVRRTAKASKVDNARVPEYLWDDRVMEAALASGMDQEQLLTALQVIRKGVLRFWKRSVAVSFYRWWKKELKAAHKEERAPSMRSLVGGSKALAHAADASWWDWDRGSAPIFLRWPREYQLEIRDGLRPRFIAPLHPR